MSKKIKKKTIKILVTVAIEYDSRQSKKICIKNALESSLCISEQSTGCSFIPKKARKI